MLNLNRVVNPKQPLYLHKVGVRFAYRPLSQDSTYGITQDTLLLSSGKFLYAHEEHIKKEKEIWKQESPLLFLVSALWLNGIVVVVFCFVWIHHKCASFTLTINLPQPSSFDGLCTDNVSKLTCRIMAIYIVSTVCLLTVLKWNEVTI